MEKSETYLYFEIQRFRQWWMWLIIFFLIIINWWAFIQQIIFDRPFGSNPGSDILVWVVFIVFGLGMPLLFVIMKLIIRCENNFLHIQFTPFINKQFKIENIASSSAITYKPIRDCGGWGIRKSTKLGWVYNVSGNRGVQLQFKTGQKIMIGSQHPERLVEAILRARRNK